MYLSKVTKYLYFVTFHHWPLLDKLINSGVADLSSHGNNHQTHLN